MPKPLLELKVEQANEDSKTVAVHSKYTIQKTHALYPRIETLIGLLEKKELRKDNALMKIVEYTIYPTFEF